MSLTRQEARALIAAAHSLHPIIIIGNQGLSEGVIQETDRALYDHELIKVRIQSTKEKTELKNLAEELSVKLKAHCLRIIGHIAILYRASDKSQKSVQKSLK